ncbi:MAG: hypothetical protein AAFV98_20405 [Chloroflexota bacterium]
MATQKANQPRFSAGFGRVVAKTIARDERSSRVATSLNCDKQSV